MQERTDSQGATPPSSVPEALARAFLDLDTVKRQIQDEIPLEEKKRLLALEKAKFLKELEDEFDRKLNESLARPTIKYGKLTGGRRIPARTSGSLEAGRVPGLAWETLNAGHANMSVELRSQIGPEVQGIERANLPFITGGTLWHLWIPRGSRNPDYDVDAFVVVVGSAEPQQSEHRSVATYFLDWTSEPIYRLNREQRFRFSRDPSCYVRFFFHLMRGLGSQYAFTLLERESDLTDRVPWDENDEAADSTKREAMKYVRPLERSYTNARGEIRVAATVFYQTAVFGCNVAINPAGFVTMEDDTLKLPDLPVLTIENDLLPAGASQ
jgi:hypothetical protein